MRTVVCFALTCTVAISACTQPPRTADAHPRSASTEETKVLGVFDDSNSEMAGEKGTTERDSFEPLAPHQDYAWRLELPDVIEQVMPSVVGIATERRVVQTMQRTPFDDSIFREFSPFFGPRTAPPGQRPPAPPRERTQQGIGSGVIVDSSGVVLTNNHVIEGADSILINLSDGRELRAEVKGTDPSSDIAVLQIENPPGDLHAIAFGNSDILRLGETVIAIGNPFGLSGTVTLGIISAKGRANVGLVDYEDFIQTDAAINPGNSGGALINLRGELVGINTAIMSRSGGYQGIGFAIPSNMAEMILQSLLETGEVQRGWLGVHIQPLTPELAGGLGVDPTLRGVVVSDVQEQSPAAQAGLTRGDVIISIDGRAVHTPAALRNTIGLRAPGAEVRVDYVRGNETRSLRMNLGSLNQQARLPQTEERETSPSQEGIEGLSLRSLDRELQSQYAVPQSIRRGVVVTAVEPNSLGAALNLRQGDVILEVNRRPVQTPADVQAAFDPQRSQNLFLLFRQGSTIFMAR